MIEYIKCSFQKMGLFIVLKQECHVWTFWTYSQKQLSKVSWNPKEFLVNKYSNYFLFCDFKKFNIFLVSIQLLLFKYNKLKTFAWKSIYSSYVWWQYATLFTLLFSKVFNYENLTHSQKYNFQRKVLWLLTYSQCSTAIWYKAVFFSGSY